MLLNLLLLLVCSWGIIFTFGTDYNPAHNYDDPIFLTELAIKRRVRRTIKRAALRALRHRALRFFVRQPKNTAPVTL